MSGYSHHYNKHLVVKYLLCIKRRVKVKEEKNVSAHLIEVPCAAASVSPLVQCAVARLDERTPHIHTLAK